VERIVGKTLRIISLALLLAALEPAVHAKNTINQPCSLSTLNGYYAMQGQGTVVQYPIGNPPFPLAEVARDHFDGAGNFMGRFVANGEGTIVQGWLPGTYSVNADCTGTITVTGLTMSFVVLGNGSLRLIDTSNWLVMKRTMEPKPKEKRGCSLGALKGTYSVQGEGTVVAQVPGWPSPPFPFAEVGRYVLDGAGNISGNYTWNVDGTIMTGTVTGTYTKEGTCIGTMVLDEGGTAVNEFFAIFGNGNLRLVQTDEWVVITRTMERMPD
jgi:hypothetical protein